MAAQFTPGPWPVKRAGDGKRYIVGDGLVEGPHGYEVAEVYSDDCDPEEAKANAHLIAAAPELYEALEELVAHVSRFLSQPRCIGKALAALSKARGETPSVDLERGL